MVQFWLDDFMELLSIDNFKLFNKDDNNYIRVLNLIAIISIILGLFLSVYFKNPKYFGISVIVLCVTILFKNTMILKFSKVPAENIDVNTNAFNTGILLKRSTKRREGVFNNKLYVNQALNLNKGDVIAIDSGENTAYSPPTETHVISDILSTSDTNEPVILLLNEIDGDFNPKTTKILKVSDASPYIMPPPDPNKSIRDSNPHHIDPDSMGMPPFINYKHDGSRYDSNLELSTHVAGEKSTYHYQGPLKGPLGRRFPTIQNPMGNIYPVEYDNTPTFYGTVNVQDSTIGVLNDKIMTESQEATVSQRVDDLLFHKGNSQAQYTPLAVDTIPNDQEGFAHFCYRNPTNLVNPKYASIFVNDPAKFKLVPRCFRVSGNENGHGLYFSSLCP